ncbi:Transcription factor RF2a [Apostasia shenzhenica]|uniref:Transcription factor RF2a n=1 Tax=Apostasia shenzhenica TaxID=1088818 RepID=A0A2I0B9H3_9ASPA|nr:Transcription factor RF2a [Apostasia shenzhenica]
MAQLPPKFPSIPAYLQRNTAAVPFFQAGAAGGGGGAPNHQTWVDEFLDFTAARRGAHRRSASDSVAFLEAVDGAGEFDRLDDDQLLSMFSDHVAPLAPAETAAAESASTPSDHNSVNEGKSGDDGDRRKMQGESEEAQSECKPELPAGEETQPPAPAAPVDHIVDPKRVKRILANRQSAQRSRVRKLQYISELERSVTTLQTEVSALSPRVAFLDHQRSILTVGNSHLKQRIAALAQDKIFKDAHQEALKKEIERLRQVYHHQSLKKMGAASENLPNEDNLS